MISLTSKRTLLSLATTVLTVLILLASVLLSGSSYGTKPALPPTADLASFSALAPIDAHVHLYKDDPAFGAFLKRLNLRVLDIIVIDDRDPLRQGVGAAAERRAQGRPRHGGPGAFLYNL